MEMSFGMIRARIAEDMGDKSDRRQVARVPFEADATMRELGASGVEAKILNISERGFMAATEAAFEVGSRLWLMLPGRQRANAVVKWTAGDKLGAEFAEPISLEGLRVAVESD
jgi:PilZ domain